MWSRSRTVDVNGKNKSKLRSRSRKIDVEGEDNSRSKDETEMVATIDSQDYMVEAEVETELVAATYSQVDFVKVEFIEKGAGRIRDGNIFGQVT